MIVTSLVLIRNRFEFKSIAEETAFDTDQSLKVSICIPARNEEDVIGRCVQSLLKQEYDNYEVLVLDDNSDDRTPDILNELSSKNDRLKVFKGSPKPDDWLGKPWACHQLSKKASGDIFTFIDADVWVEPFTISKTVSGLKKVDALTIWPQQELGSFIERLIVPSIMFSLVTLLPAVYVERKPRWMPGILYNLFKTEFLAACGQFMAFKRLSYQAINGHEGVKNQVVEDMELGKSLKRNNLVLTMRTGINSVYCRMYTSGSEVWQGFQKNFYAGFGNPITFIFAAILHILFFLFPFYSLTVSLKTGNDLITNLSLIVICIYIIQRFILNLWYKVEWWTAFFHPLAVIWFQALGVKSLINKVFGLKSNWKGRQV
jgi:chlorobactene glucosyltransferase